MIPWICLVPPEYLDLKAVFSKARATSLPPHDPMTWPSIFYLVHHLLGAVSIPCLLPKPQLSTNTSVNPAGAGFFFVGKKDSALRPCIEYRGLNNITVKKRYPLPLMSSAFELLQGAKIFSKLDLCSAYHLVRVRDAVFR